MAHRAATHVAWSAQSTSAQPDTVAFELSCARVPSLCRLPRIHRSAGNKRPVARSSSQIGVRSKRQAKPRRRTRRSRRSNFPRFQSHSRQRCFARSARGAFAGAFFFVGFAAGPEARGCVRPVDSAALVAVGVSAFLVSVSFVLALAGVTTSVRALVATDSVLSEFPFERSSADAVATVAIKLKARQAPSAALTTVCSRARRSTT